MIQHRSNSYDQVKTISDDFKEQNTRYTLSKHEDDLYKEEENIIFKVIRVKHVGMPNKEEKWKIFEDNKLVFTLMGHKLTKRERNFLHSADGINLLMQEFKSGIKSFNAIKKAIQGCIKPKTRKKRA